MRRSLRLQTRIGGINENPKHTFKKKRLPRKRKVKVKVNQKTINGVTPRRSLRIKTRNSRNISDEGNSINDQLKVQINNKFKIEHCEVKLEQIDVLIEKLNIGSPDIHHGNKQPVEGKVSENTLETPMENEQYKKENFNEQSKETNQSSAEINTNCSNEEANNTEADREQVEDEKLKEKIDETKEHEETARKLTEMLNKYEIENQIDFDEINSISRSFHEETTTDNSWDREGVPNCSSEKIINNVFFNNTNAYNFKSCFKDRASLTAAFDRHSGQVSNETYPYDIHETPEAEKGKRFYRKSITDPSLHSWYQYNLASSKRFSKHESEKLTSKPYMGRYLLL